MAIESHFLFFISKFGAQITKKGNNNNDVNQNVNNVGNFLISRRNSYEITFNT